MYSIMAFLSKFGELFSIFKKGSGGLPSPPILCAYECG